MARVGELPSAQWSVYETITRSPNIFYVFFCFPVLKRINIPNLALKTGDRIMDDGVVNLVFMLAELPHVPHLPWLAPLTHVVF